jgi:segregation and condensation protein B
MSRILREARATIEPLDRDDAGSERLSQAIRIAEALLFASREPLPEEAIAERLPRGIAAAEVMGRLQALYAGRGVNLRRIAGGWAFRTAPDLAYLLAREEEGERKLSRAALETLAIIAYHQPVTRAEIEEIRGVSAAKGTLDVLLETGWVRMRGRRRTPGRPITYGTTPAFLDHFGLDSIGDLPGLEELKGAGLLDGRLPPGFGVPVPDDSGALAPDEDALEPDLFCDPDLAAEAGEGDDGDGS